MRVDKSLQEVWDWKDKVYQATKNLSVRETAKKIHEDVERIKKNMAWSSKNYTQRINNDREKCSILRSTIKIPRLIERRKNEKDSIIDNYYFRCVC